LDFTDSLLGGLDHFLGHHQLQRPWLVIAYTLQLPQWSVPWC
jgi:hypothetical protein